MHKYQKLVAESFEVLLDADKSVDDVRPFFAKNYTQWVDGKSLDYDGFFQHVIVLKEVIAFFTFENGQIASVREMTHLLKGSESDHDLGSRT